jgi:peptidoglycan/LPS O-acetylase OafA/YrhL
VRQAVPLTIAASCVAAFVGQAILLGFLVWLCGTLLVLAYSKWALSRKSWLVSYALVSTAALAVCLVAARTASSAILGNNLSVGLSFSMFLFAVLQFNSGAIGGYYSRIARFLAGFSYSLYVLHFPLLLFLRAWLVPAQRWEPNPAHLGYGVAIGVAVLGFAWLVSIFTEGKTRIARQWMRNFLPRLYSRFS